MPNPKLQISKVAAEGLVNELLSDHLPDRYTAAEPSWNSRGYWSVPVVLTYPRLGSIGCVGTIFVNAQNGTISNPTSWEEMRAEGEKLFNQKKHLINVDFLPTRN